MSLPARELGWDPDPREEPGRAGAPERAQRAEGAKRPPRRPAPPATTGPRTARARRRKHHVGFVVLATLVIGPMVLGIVSLNALLAQMSFRIDVAERRVEQLAQEHLDLVRQQATLSAPGRIADWARRNGMRLPDDIRSLHASGGPAAPAGADPSGGDGG